MAGATTISFAGIALDGAQKENYSLTPLTQPATITPKTLTADYTAASRVYDGTTTASVTFVTLNGVISGDSVSLTGTASGSFASPDAGTGKTVTVTGVSLAAGGDSGNYSLSTPITTTATIDKANASITVTPYSVTFDGTAHTATGTATGVGGANLAAQLTLTGTTHTNAGDYPADAWSFLGGTNYNDASGTAHDVIGKATASVTLGSPSQTYDGTRRSATAVTTPPGLTVLLTYNGSGTAPTDAGSYTVVGTISDANYEGSSTGTLVISQATITITWSNPADIVYGTALSATQLNATANVPGSFLYTPAAGTVLGVADNQTLHVAFTPTDSTNYSSSSKDVLINVKPYELTISGVTANDKTYDADNHGGIRRAAQPSWEFRAATSGT